MKRGGEEPMTTVLVLERSGPLSHTDIYIYTYFYGYIYIYIIIVT